MMIKISLTARKRPGNSEAPLPKHLWAETGVVAPSVRFCMSERGSTPLQEGPTSKRDCAIQQREPEEWNLSSKKY